jgi:soluble lytic murein transglycosylase-like protein
MKFNKQISPQPRHILSQALSGTEALLLVIMLLAFGTGAKAQTVASSTATTAASASGSIQQSAPTPSSPSSKPSSIASKEAQSSPAVSYSDSLKELASLYEKEAKRLAQENDKLKQLHAEGLISRVELEASDKSVADAKAKVEATQKQIAEANSKPAILAGAPGTGFTNESWTTGNNTIDNLIRYYGGETGLDPFLIFCLMNQESGFLSRATSPKGAQGLMQMMPGTAARYGVTNPYDAAQSIRGGARYLKDLLELFNGRLDLALAGYNAGEGAVIKYGYQIPPYAETRSYVRLISSRYALKNGVSKKI